MSESARRLLSVLTGFVALAASAWAPTDASAGQYEVWSCRGPAGESLSGDAWKVRSNDAGLGDVWMSDSCQAGGPLILHMTNAGTGPRRARLDLTFNLPRGETITAYTLNRHFATAAGGPSNYVAATSEIAGGAASDWGCASNFALPNFNCGVIGSPTDPNDPSNQLSRAGIALDGLGIWIGCTTINGCSPPTVSPAARAILYGSKVTIADNVPPGIVQLGGALARSRALTGEADLFVEASDDNAGVAKMTLEVDGAPYQAVSVNTPGCVLPYQVARPCPADAGRIFSVDTSVMSEGTHVASGVVTDAAGNTVNFGPIHFVVDHPQVGPPPPDNGLPAVSDPVLNFDSDSVWHAPGAKAVAGGRLATTNGTPIAGATLNAEMINKATLESKPVALPPVTTGADGRFQVAVPGQGARKVTVSFSPSAGQIPTATVETLVRSRLGLSLKITPRRVKIGRAVRFKGQMSGAGPSAAGAPVDIQAIVSGKWETVATVATKANGRFTWRYRFRYVTSDALFSFRAQVRRSPGWPWPAVTSAVRKVRIKVGHR